MSTRLVLTQAWFNDKAGHHLDDYQYFNNPRSDGTSRELAGIGDPLFSLYPLPCEGIGSDDSAPAALGLKDRYLADCRMDYARKTYDRRVRQVAVSNPYVL